MKTNLNEHECSANIHTVDQESFMLKIICVKNFHGDKFSRFCLIREILMVEDYNMDKHLECS